MLVPQNKEIAAILVPHNNSSEIELYVMQTSSFVLVDQHGGLLRE